MQKDYKQEQNDAAGGCDNCGDVEVDAAGVSVDLASI
jgi:hypothetical protein